MSRRKDIGTGSKRSRLWGEFDWRRDYSYGGKRTDRFETEEDYINSLSFKHRQNYLETRAKRKAMWEQNIWYQRSLRITKIMLEKLNKQRLKMLRNRYRPKKLSDVEIPAEANVLIALACYKHNEEEICKKKK